LADRSPKKTATSEYSDGGEGKEGGREGGRENMRATWQHATLFSSIDWKILKDLKRKRS